MRSRAPIFCPQRANGLLFLYDMEGQLPGAVPLDWSGNLVPMTLIPSSGSDPGIVTSNPKFGTNALFASAGGVTITAQDLTFGTGDFQFDWWSRCSNSSGAHIREMFEMSDGVHRLELLFPLGVCNLYIDGINTNTAGTAQTDLTYYHNCLQRINGVLRYYLGGVSQFAAAVDFNFGQCTLSFCSDVTGSGSNNWNGTMDELRGINNTAGFFSTSGFTPPTSAYARP